MGIPGTVSPPQSCPSRPQHAADGWGHPPGCQLPPWIPPALPRSHGHPIWGLPQQPAASTPARLGGAGPRAHGDRVLRAGLQARDKSFPPLHVSNGSSETSPTTPRQEASPSCKYGAFYLGCSSKPIVPAWKTPECNTPCSRRILTRISISISLPTPLGPLRQLE